MTGMAQDRDIAAFDRRAAGYDSGGLGELHRRIVASAAELAGRAAPAPGRVLDVGCGTGLLLRLLADRWPGAELLGVDPAPNMLAVAASDSRIRCLAGVAERLPIAEGSVDLVVSTTSFDHWADQGLGLAECARVLRPGAPLVLTDLCSPLLIPTLLFGRRDRARTVGRMEKLFSSNGFRPVSWHSSLPLLKSVIAEKS
jgi:ubiquinone/menaquinone biosynthesis C-methylase UbiE